MIMHRETESKKLETGGLLRLQKLKKPRQRRYKHWQALIPREDCPETSHPIMFVQLPRDVG